MVGRLLWRVRVALAGAALVVPWLVQGQAPPGLTSGPTAGSKFPAGGVTVPVPGHPECVLTVESWENGSFLVPVDQARPAFSPQARGRWIKSGTRDTDEQPSRDEREIADQLALALKYSPDMVDKVTKACTLRGSIAIRLVRDDPFINVGCTVMDSNLVMIDMGDVAKTVSQVATVHPPGTKDLTRYEAPAQAARAFTYGLLAHEIDHLLETGDGAHLDPPRGGVPGDVQGGAVRDENLVMKEMGLAFQRPVYINVQNGRSVVVYQDQVSTTAVFDPGRAIVAPMTRRNGAPGERDFFSEDVAAVNGVDDRCCGCDGSACGVTTTTALGAPATSGPWMIRQSAGSRLGFRGSEDIGGGLSAQFQIEHRFSDETYRSMPSVANARPADGRQRMGGTMLDYTENTPVFAGWDAMPAWPRHRFLADAFAALVPMHDRWAWPRRGRLPVRAEFSSVARQAAPQIAPWTLIAVFTSLGRSSGPAFRMDVVHDGPGPIRAFGDGFVLEPLARVTQQQVQRELARIKGRRGSTTIAAYCLEFAKTPPALDTIYRLVPPDAEKAHANLPAIMAASKRLQSSRRLQPDSDPEEYFHATRQWALWSDEQGWRTEDAFGRAFVAHAQKNLASAGRPWTRQIEAAIQELVPGRWRDIEAVRAEARTVR